MSLEQKESCSGCGVKLQATDSKQLGYIPPQSLEKGNSICQRCYRIKHYNEASEAVLDENDFLRILNRIGGTESLVVNIVDLFDFEGSFVQGLHRFVGGNPVILALNKFDLLPKVTNPNKLVNWVQQQAKANGVKVAEVIILSAKKNIGFDRLVSAIEHYRDGHDVYVVGATNVGKSSVINRIIRDYSEMEEELTISQFPGTTLDIIKIPLDDGNYLIDTPGVVYHYRLTEMVRKKELQALLPQKPIKPAVYQLNEEQTLFFGSYARFDFVRGPRQSFTCYVANSIPIHRTKLQRADELYDMHKGEMLAPPDKEGVEALPPLSRQSIKIPKGKFSDISISGLGWIKVNSTEGAEIDVYVPKGVKVSIRDSII
ncbi:ribosome biogenesis GTPase YqeH [Marinicrinis lubricantis]|uniref:Ribosome biogenesis GTPase YqeH n=1 Tax=Marinicrinis lubricantis TaxID=2086470 RepID=A0ABW1IVT2_9BACL